MNPYESTHNGEPMIAEVIDESQMSRADYWLLGFVAGVPIGLFLMLAIGSMQRWFS